MKKPRLLLFLICFLLIIIGLMIYLTVNTPRISANAKLVLEPIRLLKNLPVI